MCNIYIYIYIYNIYIYIYIYISLWGFRQNTHGTPKLETKTYLRVLLLEATCE